jgi:hypothetical protein
MGRHRVSWPPSTRRIVTLPAVQLSSGSLLRHVAECVLHVKGHAVNAVGRGPLVRRSLPKVQSSWGRRGAHLVGCSRQAGLHTDYRASIGDGSLQRFCRAVTPKFRQTMLKRHAAQYAVAFEKSGASGTDKRSVSVLWCRLACARLGSRRNRCARRETPSRCTWHDTEGESQVCVQ